MQLTTNSIVYLWGSFEACRLCSVTPSADEFGSTFVFVETPQGLIEVPASHITSTKTPIDGKGSILPRHTSHTIYHVEDTE
jgi:hypothetical protein